MDHMQIVFLGIGILIVSPKEYKTNIMFKLDFDCTNNQAKHEALIVGLNILTDMNVHFGKIKGDS